MKKLLSVLGVSIAALCGITLNLSVSANESDRSSSMTLDYDPCDVNHDGYVDIADFISIQKFMNGQKHVTNYNVYDADRNMVVDYADKEYIWKHIFGYTNYSANYISRTYPSNNPPFIGGTCTEETVPFEYHSGEGVENSSSGTNSVQYTHHSYSNPNENDYDYYLSPLPMVTVNNVGNDIDAIVDGSDTLWNITNLPESNSIVRIKVWNTGRSPFCVTGFVVNNHTIATAAHCVYGDHYETGSEDFYNNIEITFYNSNGTISNETLNEIAVHIPTAYKTSDSRENDYALITVEDNISSSSHPYFAIGNYYNLLTLNYSHIPIYVTGCPASPHNSDNSNGALLYTQMGHLSSTNNTDSTYIRYNVDTLGGDSGAPVYTVIKDSNNNYFYTALSLHQGGNDNDNPLWNEGVRFNKYHKQFYMNNPDAIADYQNFQ